jgi:ribonuclease BN (tRNA processing enzyme)
VTPSRTAARTGTGRLVVVGCGTVVPEADRACSCYWLESGPVRALLDCGPGLLQAMARLDLPWASITDVVLTHFHADHAGGLPGLMFTLSKGLLPEVREEPLDVWGPPGTRLLLERLADAYGEFVLAPGFQLRVHDLAPGAEATLGAAVELRTLRVPHTEASQALRLASGLGVVAFTGDTGPCQDLPAFAAGADLLICECSLPDSHAIDTHLSPGSVGPLAAAARPGLLLLTHVYPQFRTRADVPALVRASGWDGPIEMAREGWTFPA